MAEILLFPAADRISAAQWRREELPPQHVPTTDSGVDDCQPEAAEDNRGLDAVAALAVTPSPTLVFLTGKVELLVARLTGADADAGLCNAEAQLLQSALSDLRAFTAMLATRLAVQM